MLHCRLDFPDDEIDAFKLLFCYSLSEGGTPLVW
jgi:hypothetical protein